MSPQRIGTLGPAVLASGPLRWYTSGVRPLVYIETTIPGFYHELRPEPDMIARRAWTREWWDRYRSQYEVVTSVAALDEFQSG